MTHRWSLPADTTAAAAGRELVRVALTDWGNAGDVIAVVSELCTNAILHGKPPIILNLTIESGQARLEVSNHNRAGGTTPQVAPADANIEAVGGRGLRLVTILTTSWGSQVTDEMTTVWAQVPINPDR